MITKKKMCAGFDGVEHEAYIYKNINGKKYCKSCTYKLQKPKAIPKVSESMKLKIVGRKEQWEEDKKFYTDLWIEQFFDSDPDNPGEFIRMEKPKCECCDTKLDDVPTSVNFHHILEKRNYPQYRHIRINIAIVCGDCHSDYENDKEGTIGHNYLSRMKEVLLKETEMLDFMVKNRRENG